MEVIVKKIHLNLFTQSLFHLEYLWNNLRRSKITRFLAAALKKLFFFFAQFFYLAGLNNNGGPVANWSWRLFGEGNNPRWSNL